MFRSGASIKIWNFSIFDSCSESRQRFEEKRISCGRPGYEWAGRYRGRASDEEIGLSGSLVGEMGTFDSEWFWVESTFGGGGLGRETLLWLSGRCNLREDLLFLALSCDPVDASVVTS